MSRTFAANASNFVCKKPKPRISGSFKQGLNNMKIWHYSDKTAKHNSAPPPSPSPKCEIRISDSPYLSLSYLSLDISLVKKQKLAQE